MPIRRGKTTGGWKKISDFWYSLEIKFPGIRLRATVEKRIVYDSDGEVSELWHYALPYVPHEDAEVCMTPEDAMREANRLIGIYLDKTIKKYEEAAAATPESPF